MTDRLVSAAELAEYLGMSKRWVYDNKADLGVRRVGGRLRFSIAEADARLRRRAELTDPDPISPGQSRALHAKANDLDALLERPRGESKRQALTAASLQFSRTLTSTLELNSIQASWVLDWLEEELAVARGYPVVGRTPSPA